MPRAPSQPFAGLLRRDELVLIEPGADVVALLRSLEADFILVTSGIGAGAHDIDAEWPAFVGKMKYLAFDGAVVGLDHKAIGFGQVRNMNPGPASLAVAAEDKIAFLRHSE